MKKIHETVDLTTEVEGQPLPNFSFYGDGLEAPLALDHRPICHLTGNLQPPQPASPAARKESKARLLRRERPKTVRQLEQEGRAAGFARPLQPDNKGFAMLVRMGYSPGKSLGLGNTGQLEPVTMKVGYPCLALPCPALPCPAP